MYIFNALLFGDTNCLEWLHDINKFVGPSRAKPRKFERKIYLYIKNLMHLLISSYDASTIGVKRAFHPDPASRGFVSHVFLVYNGSSQAKK